MTVTVIPPHKKCRRTDHPDLIFTHAEAKLGALIREILQVHATGRPVLVGSRTVAESEGIAEALREAQAHPENHRDLIVRVAGYSDYFCDLSVELQEEIITRTEHEAF